MDDYLVRDPNRARAQYRSDRVELRVAAGIAGQVVMSGLIRIVADVLRPKVVLAAHNALHTSCKQQHGPSVNKKWPEKRAALQVLYCAVTSAASQETTSASSHEAR